MRIRILFALFLVLTASVGLAQAEPAEPAESSEASESQALATEDEKTVYAIGLSVWKNISSLDLTPEELEIFLRALSDASSGGDVAVDLERYEAKIGQFRQARAQARAERAKQLGAEYAETEAQKEGAVKKSSGLVYFELEPGTGEQPAATSSVRVHYRGTFVDGTEFDSSYRRGEPATFPLNRVIACWTEGLQLMREGGKGRLICPSDIAYGDRGRGPIPGGSTLVFEVELIEIKKPDPVPAETE